jgi:hypothetical protein
LELLAAQEQFDSAQHQCRRLEDELVSFERRLKQMVARISVG